MMLAWWFSNSLANLICVKVKIHLFMSLETRSTKEQAKIVEVVTTSISDDWLTIFTHDKASIRWY